MKLSVNIIGFAPKSIGYTNFEELFNWLKYPLLDILLDKNLAGNA